MLANLQAWKPFNIENKFSKNKIMMKSLKLILIIIKNLKNNIFS